MVTRKTRLLSAFAALLMLVSLFTCFAMPATALKETTPTGLTAYKNRTPSDTAKEYAITDAEDWLRFVADSNGNADYGPLKSSTPQPFKGYNLWMTNDIDFEGVNLDVDGDGTIEIYEFCVSADTNVIPSTATNKDDDYFYGYFYGQGHAIKNLVVDIKPVMATGAQSFGLFAYLSTARIMDLTIDKSCSFTVRLVSDGIEGYVGVFSGYSANTAYFVNCKNEASLDVYDEGTNKTNSISCFGRKQRGYLINCINTGALTNHDVGRVTVFAEWMNSTTSGRNVYLYNCVNTGVLTTAGDYTTGLVSTNGTDSIANQIFVYNSYAVGCHIGSGNDLNLIDPKGTMLDSGVEKTGELAYLMNKGYNTQHDGTYGRAYFTVKGENIAIGTAAEQPIKLNFTFGADKKTVYAVADADGKVNLAELYPIAGGIYEASAGTVEGNTLTATPATEINVTVTSTELIYTHLQNKIDFFNARNIAYYKDSNGVVLTADVLSSMQDKINGEDYENQAEIDADIVKLEGYTFDKSSLIPIGEFDKYSDVAVKYSIASKADMETLVEIAPELEADVTLYITADIDMEGSDANRYGNLTGLKAAIDGGNKTIENLYVTTAFLPSYQGAFVKDLTFKNGNVISTAQNSAFLVDKAQYDLTVSNVTLDGVVGKSDYGTTGGMQGLLICQIANGADIELKDITIVNSTMTRPAGTEYWNSGLVLGKTYAAKLLIDGVYLNGNTVDGERTGGGGRGIAIGEIICNAEVKNVVVLNTTAVDANVSGIFAVIKEHGSDYDVDPKITVENIIAYNNGETENLVTSGTTSAGSTITFKNIYTDTAKILSNATHEGYTVEDSCVVDAAAAITSGEAAWALNAALAGDKWTMDNGLPAFGTEENQTVRVALEMEGFEAEYLYVNMNQEATLAHSVPGSVFTLKNDTDPATLNGDKLTVTGLPTEELTVSVVATLATMSFDALDAKIEEIGEKADFYINGNATMTAVLAEIKARRANEYDGYTPLNILEDLALLNSYTLTEVDTETVGAVTALRDELAAYGDLIEYFNKAADMKAALNDLTAVLADVEAADGIEAAAINKALAEAADAYNALEDWTIVAGSLIPIKNYDLFKNYTKNWAVGDEADWRKAVEALGGSNTGADIVLKLTADIDMAADGDNSVVAPLMNQGKYFNGTLDGQGHVFKNLKIEVTSEEFTWVGLVSAIGATGVVEDLGIESGSVQLTHSTDVAARLGTIVGNGAAGSVIRNCWNAASVTLLIGEGGNKDSYVGGICGSATRWATIDGCYNLGAVHSDGNHAAGIDGWTQGGDATYAHGRVYNSFNYGTVTCVTNPTYIGAVRTGGGSVGSVANTYAIGTKLVFIADTDAKIESSSTYLAAMSQNNEDNSNLPAEIYATGELAWKLNSGWAEGYSNHTDYPEGSYAGFNNYEEIHPYYTVKDGKTVFGTEENQTVRVTIKHDGIETYFYANADAEDIALGSEGTYVVESGAAEIKAGNLLDITNATDVVLTVSSETYPAGHEHDLAYTDHENGTHTPYCTYEATIDGRTFVCEYVGETVACSNLTYAVVTESINAETHAHQSIATCEDCGYVAEAADCNAGYNEDVTLEPECEAKGEKTFTCKNDCGYSYTEDIDENGHDKNYASNGDNTHQVTCKNCELNVPETCTPDENGWQVTDQPSIDEEGVKETTCTVCFGKVTAPIAKLAAVTAEAEINADETEVTATVGLLNNPGVKTVTVKVAFDYTVMDLDAVVAQNGLTVGTPVVEDGMVTFTVTADAELTADDELAVVTFTMKTEEGDLVAANKNYELNVTAEAANAAEEPVALEAGKAIFEITKGKSMVKGDLTGDKEINLADAIILLRYVTGDDLPEAYEGLITDDMADLTDEGDGTDLGDGQIVPEVNTNDVIYLLRYLNGWINEL